MCIGNIVYTFCPRPRPVCLSPANICVEFPISSPTADREVQRILLELLNQMDGFDQSVNVKVRMMGFGTNHEYSSLTGDNGD